MVPRAVVLFGLGPPLRDREDEPPAPSARGVADVRDDLRAFCLRRRGVALEVSDHSMLIRLVPAHALFGRPYAAVRAVDVKNARVATGERGVVTGQMCFGMGVTTKARDI